MQEVAIPYGQGAVRVAQPAADLSLDESYEPLPKDDSEPCDYFHLNAIEQDGGGAVLVSAPAHAHDLQDPQAATARCSWRLGGKKSTFRLGRRRELRVAARPAPARGRNAHALRQRREPAGSRARVARARPAPRREAAHGEARPELQHPRPLLSTSQGNAQVLPDGHVFVGWGSNEYFTEFDRRGRVLFDVRFGCGEADSYRAYRLPWVGRPSDRPAVAARERGVRTVVFASWNGATEVARWRVLAGENASQLASAGEASKRGFETRIVLPSRPRVRRGAGARRARPRAPNVEARARRDCAASPPRPPSRRARPRRRRSGRTRACTRRSR